MTNYPQNKLLSLHFSQLSKAWQRSSYNTYSDSAKSDYHKNLGKLFDAIKSIDYNSIGAFEISSCKTAIDFLFKSIEFLDSSTLNLIPFETVECLTYALKDWQTDEMVFTIVTNLVKNISGYSFDPSLTKQEQYAQIEIVYGVHFNSRLVQINVPLYLSRDYLASVVLYHELGHFINIYHNICKSIIIDFESIDVERGDVKALLSHFFHMKNNEIDELIEYYRKDLKSEKLKILKKHMLNYFGEYFCDLFAVQYVGESFTSYLDYIEPDSSATYTHPSKERRIELMQTFLKNNKESPAAKLLIDLIQKSVERITKQKLHIRFAKTTGNSLYDLVPEIISTPAQLHAIFIKGWECWGKSMRNSDLDFVASHKENTLLRYEIINNLIEKSIGNYIVERDWKKAHE